MVGAVSNHLCIGGSNGQILRPNLQLPISRQAGGLFYGTCLLMSYFHQHTCSWHLYLLEKNNYSLGDLSHDTCRCAYAIGSLHTTNITTRYVCDLFLMNYFHKRTCGRHEIFSPARVNPCTLVSHIDNSLDLPTNASVPVCLGVPKS